MSFYVIIVIQLLQRTYVTIEGGNYFAADFKKRTCVVYESENKLSSYHGLIEDIYDYGEKIMFKVSKLHSGIEYIKIGIILFEHQ